MITKEPVKKTGTRSKRAAETDCVSKAALRIHPAMRGFVGYCFYKIALTIRGKMDARMGSYGLVGAQSGILLLVNKVGPITQVELGNHMCIDKASMVRFIDGLEERKLIMRVPDATDRRVKRLELTKAGEKLLEVINKNRQEVEAEIFAPLSKGEIETLRGLIARVATPEN